MVDLMIPLGTGSKSGNDELRILLRSAERNVRDLGRVVIITNYAPDWIQNAVIVPCGDPLKHNKDGNMINKVMVALEALDIRGDFCLTCDDTVFNMPMSLSECPLLFNSKCRKDFLKDKRWHRRMVRTFDYLASVGIRLEHNYEVHAPQVFNGDILRSVIPAVDYKSDIGYGIFTLFRALSGETGGVEQSNYKTTHEDVSSAECAIDRLFAGYNDTAFNAGLRERLFGIFNNKSKYER